MTTAFPLTWPAGWPRTHFPRRWRGGKGLTFARCRDVLLKELRLLGARNVVLSTNYELGVRTNLPLSSKRVPEDKGIAVYFTLKGKALCMACDRYSSAEGNIRSLTLAIAGMRALERHGGGFMMERAFAGFEALPPPSSTQAPPRRTCWQVLGINNPSLADAYTVSKSYRNRAKELHPDQPGGSQEAMTELNAARDEAMRILSTRGSAR